MPLSFRIHVFNVNKHGMVRLDDNEYQSQRVMIVGDKGEDRAKIQILDDKGKVSQSVYLDTKKEKDGGTVTLYEGEVTKSTRETTSTLGLNSEQKIMDKNCGVEIQVKAEKWNG